MTTNRRSAAWAVALLMICAALCGVGRIAAAQEEEEGSPEDAATVEAVGMAQLPEGRDVQEAHQEALVNARRNALLQAHVALEAATVVHNMRLGEATITSLARGYLRASDVIEAGPVETDGARMYRVRLRAVVAPLSAVAGGAPGEDAAGRPWQPAVKLGLHSERGEADQTQLATVLVTALQRCGIAVLPREAAAPALVLRVAAGKISNQEVDGTRIVYQLGYDAPPPGATAVAPATGHWVLSAATEQGEWWQRLATVMAQDALRLWGSPRPTALSFQGLTTEQAEELTRVARARPGARVRDGDEGEVAVILPVAGDPRPVAEALLREAGVEEPPEPTQLSLTQLTYALGK